MKKKKVILNIAFLFFLCVFIYSIFMLSRYFIFSTLSEKRNDEIAFLYNEEVSNEKSGYQKLLEINSEAVGFLNIESIDVSYPVLQGKDNEKYLHRDFELKKNKNGGVFVDYRIDVEKDRKIILYGHNMKSGNMFSKLLKLSDTDNFKTCSDILFDIKEESTRWEIFAAFYTSSQNEKIYSLDISSDEEFLKEIKKNQGNFKDVDIKNKRILMLSTCTYKDMDRFVVLAVEK